MWFAPHCPKCGRALRPVRDRLWCDFCGSYVALHTRWGEGFRSRLASLEHSLRARVDEFLSGRRGPKPIPPPSITLPATSIFCQNCGYQTQPEDRVCSQCGAALAPQLPTLVPTPIVVREPPVTTAPTSLDDRVYRYIIDHDGTISLSKASNDLGITMDALKASIARLKESGKLSDETLS